MPIEPTWAETEPEQTTFDDIEPGVPVAQEEEVEGTEMEPALMGTPAAPPAAAPPLAMPPPRQGPVPPQTVLDNPQLPVPGSPYVPFQIGRRDPVTGQVTTVSGYGMRAQPPDPNSAFWSRLRQKTANLPLAQTEAAVSAAMRFQGQRQYQRDLQSGMDPAQALARSAPLIFNSPKTSSLGQAAQFMRANRPVASRVRDVGGVLYRENAQGGWDPITPQKAAAPKVSPFDTEEYRSLLQEMRAVEKDLNEPALGDTDRAALARRGRALQKSLQEIRARYPTSPTSTGSTSTQRIRVRAPNGKFGSIPANQLEAAMAAGYQRVQ